LRRLVLADTGPLYAALDPDDQHHRRAQAEIGRLNAARLGVAVLYPTLLEAYSLSLHRLGPAVARRWLAELSDRAPLVSPIVEDYLAARQTVDAFADQPLTLFDAVLAAACRRLGVAVWTFDHHFDLMRVDVWRD
jgi:predicted nucleic acid-binding protein